MLFRSHFLFTSFLASHVPEILSLVRGVYFVRKRFLWCLMGWNATFHVYPFNSSMKIFYGMVFRLLRGVEEFFYLLITYFLSKKLDKCGTLAADNLCAIYKSPYSYGLLFFITHHFYLIFSPCLKHNNASLVGPWMAKIC